MKRYMLFCFFFFFIFGCAPKAINPGNIAIANSSFDMISQSYDELKQFVIDKWDSFSPENQSKLKMIDDNVERIRASILVIKLKNYQDVTVTEMGYIYTLAVQSYNLTVEVLKTDGKILTGHEQMTLALMDSHLKNLDNKVQTMLKNPDPEKTKELISNIVLVVGTGLKAVIPLLLL